MTHRLSSWDMALRGGEKMFGWAEHLASWGIKTVVPTLCHYNVLNGVDHEMNGQNMVELAAVVGATLLFMLVNLQVDWLQLSQLQ